MNIESVPIASISPDPANARRHPARNIESIKSSLRRFGQQKPIVVDANNIVRAGNGTLEAARALGWTEVNIVRTDLKGAEAAAYGIADNRTGELAEWDAITLAKLLAEPDIGDVGFSESELAEITGDCDNSRGEAEDVDEFALAGKFEIAIECSDEEQQRTLYDELTARGLSCRLLTL
jgi:ParB family chromosome partitioning protein